MRGLSFVLVRGFLSLIRSFNKSILCWYVRFMFEVPLVFIWATQFLLITYHTINKLFFYSFFIVLPCYEMFFVIFIWYKVCVLVAQSWYFAQYFRSFAPLPLSVLLAYVQFPMLLSPICMSLQICPLLSVAQIIKCLLPVCFKYIFYFHPIYGPFFQLSIHDVVHMYLLFLFRHLWY